MNYAAGKANRSWPDYQNYRGGTMRICYLPLIICWTVPSRHT